MLRVIISICLAAYSISLVNTHNRTAVCVKENVPMTNASILNSLTNYKELIQRSNIFVDKSLLIKEVLENDAKIILITCPRKWGKSVNMNMIKTFIEIPVNKNGTLNDTSSYKLFREGIIVMPDGQSEKLNKSLLIATEKKLFEKYHAKYPVMYIRLGIIRNKDWTSVFQQILEKISGAFLEHNYIAKALEEVVNDENRTEEERKQAEINLHIFTTMANKQSQNEEDIKKSLKFLCQMLHQYHGKPVFVLLDEYDNVLLAILNSRFMKPEDLKKAADFLGALYDHLFLNNEYLAKAVIHGNLCLRDDTLFGKFKNILTHDAIDNKWSRFYGFNPREATILFNNAKLQPELKKRGHYWYHGYRMNRDSNLTLYNPWSVADFLEYRTIENYWELVENPPFFRHMFHSKRMRELFESLVHDKQTSIPFHRLRFTTNDLVHLMELFQQKKEDIQIQEKTVDLFLSYLCAMGYLTFDGISYDAKKGINVTLLRLPTEEVADEWRKRLTWHYRFIDKIIETEMIDFSDALNEYMLNDTIQRDTLINRTELLIKDLPLFSPIPAVKAAIKRSLLYYISAEMRSKHQYYTIMANETDKPDIILFKKGRGIFLKIQLDAHETDAIIKELEKFGEIFYTDRRFVAVKYIAIAITERKNVHIAGQVHERVNLQSTTTTPSNTSSSLIYIEGKQKSIRTTTAKVNSTHQ